MLRMIAIFETGDLRGIEQVIDRSYVDHQGLAGLDMRGPEEFSRVVVTARTSLRDLQIVVEDLISEDDKVVARLRWRGATPNGEKVERETIDIVRFANGRAHEHWGAQHLPEANVMSGTETVARLDGT